MTTFTELFSYADGNIPSPWFSDAAFGGSDPVGVIASGKCTNGTTTPLKASIIAHGAVTSGDWQLDFDASAPLAIGDGSITMYMIDLSGNGYGQFIGNSAHILRYDGGIQQLLTNPSRPGEGNKGVSSGHFTLTRVGATGVMQLYIDGVPWSSVTDTTYLGTGSTYLILNCRNAQAPTYTSVVDNLVLRESIIGAPTPSYIFRSALSQPRVSANSGAGASPRTQFQFYPAAAILTVTVSQDSSTGTISISDSSGLTWTRVAQNTSRRTEVWVSSATSGSGSNTVTITSTDTTSSISAKVDVWANVDPTTPVGAVSNGSTSTTNNLTAAGVTTTATGSVVLWAGTEDNTVGAPVSADSDYSAFLTDTMSGIEAFKTIPTLGTAATVNFDAAGTSAAAWSWCAVELLPIGGAAPTGKARWQRHRSGLMVPFVRR